MSQTPPYGAVVVVYREGGAGREFLLLHRAHHGPEYEGDWAWGPPSGARYPGEEIDRCAARELYEETGIELSPRPIDLEQQDWPVYLLEAPLGIAVTLSAEHDCYAWLPLEEAARCILPDLVCAAFRAAALAAN